MRSFTAHASFAFGVWGARLRVSRRRTAQPLDHGTVVADGPPLGDAPAFEALHEGDLVLVVAGGDIGAAEASARPGPSAPAELDHVVAFGRPT
jgi:hypothetical protein